MLRRDDGHVLRKALEFEVKGKRKQGQPKKTWKTQVEKESKTIGLEKEFSFFFLCRFGQEPQDTLHAVIITMHAITMVMLLLALSLVLAKSYVQWWTLIGCCLFLGR